MKTLCVSVFLFCTAFLKAQAPDILWQHSYGGSGWDQANAIRTTPDSGFIVSGYTGSDDHDVSELHGNYDVWLIKLDSEGNLEWEKTYGGSNFDFGQDIQVLPDSGYIVAGYTYSNDGDITFNHGNVDAWILRLDSGGNILWQKSYGGSAADEASAITKAMDGGYVFAGQSGSVDGDITAHHGAEGETDFWVVKIDSVGVIQWERSLGSYSSDAASSVIQTIDGGFVAAGWTYANGGDVTGFHGTTDMWVVKLDSGGNLEWQKAIGGSYVEEATGIIEFIDGSFTVTAGPTWSNNGDITDFIGGLNDAFVVNLTAAGEICRTKCYGGTSWDDPRGIFQLSTGNIIIAGYSSSEDVDLTETYGGGDFWVFEIDTAGNMMWQKSLGGTNGEIAFSCTEAQDGSVVVVGYTKSIDHDLTFNYGNWDIWIVKLGFCTESIWYADTDGDGYGNIASDSTACAMPTGYVADSTDCEDTNENIYPGAEDICNSIDDNCNGEIDEDALFITYFADMDGDDFGDAAVDSTSCSELTGYVLDSADCDDTNENIYPGATEICNFLDDDCDGYVDDNLAFVWLYQDADNDNYGNATIDTLTCETLTGYVPDSTDCDDSNPDIYPGAPEVLNGLDDDCDGVADEGLAVEENASPEISLYPNPAQSAITLVFSSLQNEPVQAEICNNIGEKIRDVSIDNVATEVDISQYTDGVYFVVITIGDGKFVLPFVKTE